MKCMKYVAMMVMLVAIGCTPSLYAQSNDVDLMIAEAWTLTGTVRTNIPFAFSVADKKFEPGSYSISRNGEKAITIQEASTKAVVVVLTNAVSVAPNVTAPKLVFHRYGDKYFLAQAWLRESDAGRQLFESSEEKRMARDSRQVASDHAGK